MVRLIGLWTEPADIAAFEREYLGSHFPRLAGFDGATGSSTARCLDGPYYRMTEVSFSTLDEITQALESPLGRSILTDARALAEKFGVRLDVLVVAAPS